MYVCGLPHFRLRNQLSLLTLRHILLRWCFLPIVQANSAGAFGDMTSQSTPSCVYLLADHLDMLLAAGEDLQKLEFHNQTATPDEEPAGYTLEAFIRRTRDLESAAIGRLMCARTQAAQLEGEDARFSLLARLFLSGTAHLGDVLQQYQNPEMTAFDYGDDPIGYLRSRGLVAEHTGCLSIVEKLSNDDDFLIGGHIELGALLDLCAQFLDTLDTQFGLFPDIPPASEVETQAVASRPSFF